MAFEEDFAKYKGQAGVRTSGLYNQGYEEAYRQKQMARFGQEIPLAQEIMQAAQSGEMGAQQRLGLGQIAAQQLESGVAGQTSKTGAPIGAIAARQGIYGAGQSAYGQSVQAAQAGQQQLEQARGGVLEAQMRQMGYGLQLSQEEMRRRAMIQQAQQAYVQSQLQQQAAEEARNQQIVMGLIGGAGAMGSTAAKGFGGGGTPPAPTGYEGL